MSIIVVREHWAEGKTSYVEDVYKDAIEYDIGGDGVLHIDGSSNRLASYSAEAWLYVKKGEA